MSDGQRRWHLVLAVIAVTSAMVGVHWDIAWHRSIGRDTFWSPPHLLIYTCGIVGGLTAAALIFKTTFGDPRGQDTSVRVWGFRGPLGAFMMAWGGAAMIVSAPFDDWWHNAYGLDVKIISPPHALLGAGIISIEAGAMILILGEMNRAQGAARKLLERLFLYVGAMVLVFLMIFMLEHTDRSSMHNGSFYRELALVVPVALTGVGRASGHRWGSTLIAGIYSLFLIALLWIFPLVPAIPKLGPVYYPVTHLIPAPFPLLLVAPAIALDLLRRRGLRLPTEAVVGGLLYFAVFLTVQWWFAEFLMTPWARNWVFGTHYFDYNTRPNWNNVNHRFWKEHGSQLVWPMGALFAVISTGLGILWGNGMRLVKR
jgi:hypothetical protein